MVCSEDQGIHFHFQPQDSIYQEFVETLKVLYKNGFAFCNSVFQVLITKTNTWRGFEMPFVILKLPTL